MNAPAPTEWITLAHLKRPQGRKGEILAELLTDFPERFRERPDVFLAPAGFAGLPAAARSITIANYWLPVGRNQGRVVLAFSGIDSISAAEALENLEVIVPGTERVPLDEDSEYISDLMDASVYDVQNGVRTLLGTVQAIDFPTTADGTRRLESAAPLLTVVDHDGAEILIPYVQAFILSISTSTQTIEMCLPSGLVELNRTQPERQNNVPDSGANFD